MTKKLSPIKLLQVGRSLVLNVEGTKYNFTSADKEVRENVKKAVEVYNKAPNQQRLDKVIKLVTPKVEAKLAKVAAEKTKSRHDVKKVKRELKEKTKEITETAKGLETDKPDPELLNIIKKDSKFKVIDGNLFLDPFTSVSIPKLLVNEIAYYKVNNIDITPLVNFWKLALLNPNPIARTKLFDYLSKQKLLITKSGYFVTYRMVKTTNTPNVFTDAHTKTMKYIPGSVCRIPRSECDEDGARDCSRGLHTGTPRFIGIELGDGYRKVTTKEETPDSYGTGYDRPTKNFDQTFGNQAIICLINPMHVVSVPNSDTRKMRSCEFYFCSLTTAEEVMNHQLNDYTSFDDLYHEFEASELDAMLKQNGVKKAIDLQKLAKSTKKKVELKETLNKLKSKLQYNGDNIAQDLSLEDINKIIQSRLK